MEHRQHKRKSQKYTKICTVRLTDEEYECLLKNSKTANLSASEFIRQLLNESKIIEYNSWIDRKQLINEINHIGVNINQIVKNINCNYYSNYEKLKLFAMLKKLYELLDNKL